MKWQKALENKRIIVAVIVALGVIVTAVVIAVNMRKKSTLDSDIGKQTYPSCDADDKESNTDSVDTGINEDVGGDELEVQDVLDEYHEESKNSTSASGAWNDEESKDDKSSDKGKPTDQADKEEDIVESDIVYGDIY